MKQFCLLIVLVLSAGLARADIGIISPDEAYQLINSSDPAQRPIVLDTRGGYKDYSAAICPRPIT